MTARDLVDHHVLGDAIGARRRDMREVAAEGLLDIGQRRSRGMRDRFVELRGRAPRNDSRMPRVARSALNDS